MAVRTRTAFKATKNSRYTANTTGDISSGDGADTFEDVADSMVMWEDDVLDEDDMASNSDTHVPTQQSVKAYVDAQVAGGGSSGTYTPTLTNTTNVTSSTPTVTAYLRIGNVVHVAGTVTIQTTGVGTTELRMALPVASDFANASECAGTLSNGAVHGYVNGNAANNVASFNFSAAGAVSSPYVFMFTYQVI